MCAIYLGHPKLCHQPDYPFISGLRAYPTKIRLSSTLTEGPLKMPPSWKTGFLSLSLSVAPFPSLTPEGPPNSQKLHKEILTKKDTLWTQLWWCRKSKQKPGMLSPQWANRSWNPERGLLWFIFVFLLLDVQSEIWYFPSVPSSINKLKERSSPGNKTKRWEEGRRTMIERRWKHFTMQTRVSYLLCGCILSGPLIG